MPDSHLLVFEGLMIDRHAKRGTDLVLPRIALSNVTAVIEHGAQSPCGLQMLLDPLRHLDHVWLDTRQWNYGNFYGRQVGVQVQHRALLAALEFLLFIGIHQEGQGNAIYTARRL